ncbi:XAC2610-related protein [Flavobacterium geliluteum]|uniref:MORN repeat protein n=1 Tax=Flavobacterium geliluteum TaxID=2816120 RepID=A0A940X6J0_9FLAO|nr:hypothetical protein [Flavobacterium geliluteum]MBP4137644.1 hypothetical protein [Flavobacterium geliluteum]
MKKILILLLFTWSQTTFAQKTTITTFLHFTGKIAQYPIVMTVGFEKGKDTVYGEYYYLKSGKNKNIYTKGTFNQGKIKLEETTYVTSKGKTNPQKTGSFSLHINNQYELIGTWQNEKKDKQFNVTLTCLENLSAFDPKNFSFKLNQYKGKTEGYDGELQEQDLINRLEIFNSKKEKIQTLSGFNEAVYDQTGEIEFEDLNFDGVLDLKIAIYFPNRIKYDGSFMYFIYDKAKGQFVRNLKLEELEYLTFDQVNKEFVKMLADGSGNESDSYYKWSNNNFYLIRKVENFEDKDKTFYTEYQIKNNQSVKFKEYQR